MRRLNSLLFVLAIAATGCGLRPALPGSGSPTPFIITATLPPTAVPSATLTPLPPTPSPTTVPIEGMTTTQVNVRVKPSTAGTQVAILPPFSKVQVVGQDADSNWYMIIQPDAPEGIGWVSAQYIHFVSGKDKIPVVGGVPTAAALTPNETPGTTLSGTVLQQINVRSGPSTDAEPLGMLNAKDVVTLVGRDPSGSWYQIQYTGGPSGLGWVFASYIDAPGAENLPIVGSSGAEPATQTPLAAQPPTASPAPIALEDGDSPQAPGTSASLSPSGTRTMIYSSELSTPAGDEQDWVGFTSTGPDVLLALSCAGGAAVSAELEQGVRTGPGSQAISCGETSAAQVAPNSPYLLHLSIVKTGAPGYVRYSLRVESTD